MSRIRKLRPARFALTILLLLALLPVVGCVGTSHTVTGLVTLNGQPVTGGTIYFTRYETGTTYNPDGSVAQTFVTPFITSATIASDGTYSTSLGESYVYTVTLTNPQAPQSGMIPARYASDTGLSYNVYPNNDGSYTYNVNLAP
jgi:hypothetical protein